MTIKAQEALNDAYEAAAKKKNPQAEPEHLLLALISQKDGVCKSLLGKAGANAAGMIKELNEAIERFPVLSGAAQMHISAELNAALRYAFEKSEEMKDEYVSTEHLLLGCLDQAGSGLRQILSRNGADPATVEKAIIEERKGSRVTDADPEGKMNAF
jgi:ATP-dependent Clp protease ATP-binding subunit ClpB